MIEGTLHAREWIVPATATWIIKEFLTSTDPEMRALAENIEWHIFPVVNPDGYVYTFTTVRNHCYKIYSYKMKLTLIKIIAFSSKIMRRIIVKLILYVQQFHNRCIRSRNIYILVTFWQLYYIFFKYLFQHRMWRKNRSTRNFTSCASTGVDDDMSNGVDLNRNFDFAWMGKFKKLYK